MPRINIEGTQVLSLVVKEYWEQSVNGFGSYSQEISEAVYKKHINNNSSVVEETEYTVDFRQISNDSYFIFINVLDK